MRALYRWQPASDQKSYSIIVLLGLVYYHVQPRYCILLQLKKWPGRRALVSYYREVQNQLQSTLTHSF